MKADLLSLEAGAAAVDITPPMPVALAGHFTRRDSEGVLDPLHARAVVIGNGETKLVFILLDLIALTAEDSDPIRRLIADSLAIPIANVCVSCTHTHTAPGVKDSFITPREAAYLSWAKPRIIQAAREATQAMVPAQVAWGNGKEARPQYNRRFHMRDGRVQMNPGAANREKILRSAGPTDPTLPLLLLRRAEDKTPLAVIANYSLHYVGDFGSMKVSADYFGEFSRIASERLGESCVALLTHGASGDINNTNHQNLPAPWYPEKMGPKERSQLIAGWLVDQVEEIWKQAEWHSESVLSAVEEKYFLRVRKPRGDEIERSRREAADEAISARERIYAAERLALLEYPETLPQSVTSLRVGKWAASTLTGEVFCQFGIDLRYASPYEVTALIELANGYCGYLPTRYSYVLGGYETWLARSAFAEKGSGEEMIAIAARQLRELWQAAI